MTPIANRVLQQVLNEVSTNLIEVALVFLCTPYWDKERTSRNLEYMTFDQVIVTYGLISKVKNTKSRFQDIHPTKRQNTSNFSEICRGEAAIKLPKDYKTIIQLPAVFALALLIY